MIDDNFVRTRITQLRLKKGASEYKMSLELGHNKSYMQNISSGRGMPSLSEFIYMCDAYFKISLKDFFDDGCEDPFTTATLKEHLQKLNEQDQTLLLKIAQRMAEKP